jgi:hypothetical protein
MCNRAALALPQIVRKDGQNNLGVTMFTMFRNTAIGAAAALGLCVGLAVPAQAGFIVTLQQVGANVVATSSGSIDTTDLSPESTSSLRSGVIPNAGSISIGTPSFQSVNVYIGISGPGSFGSGGGTFPSSSGSGDNVAIVDGDELLVSVGYVSGTPLSDMSTYDNATFASLGVTPGTYEWTWGTGANQNFTLDIEVATATPEPASLPLLVIGLAGLGMVLRTRRA